MARANALPPLSCKKVTKKYYGRYAIHLIVEMCISKKSNEKTIHNVTDIQLVLGKT